MVITYYGLASVKVQFGDMVLAFAPVGKDAYPKASRFGADIALVPVRDAQYNGVDSVIYGDKEPFLIDGAGEYEIKGIYVKGVASVGPEGKINTIYTVLLEGMTLCHLGALSKPELSAEIVEQLGEIDLLFLPVYNHDLLTAAAADAVATELEPKIVVPLYARGGDYPIGKDPLTLFLKESGEEGSTPVEKLTLKKKDLEHKEGEIVVLAPYA